MKIEPILDNVLILPDTAPTQKGGILLAYAPPTLTGTVLAVGPGRIAKNDVLIPVTVKTGDRVWFERQMGTELKSEGRLVRMLSERHILGVVGADVELEPAPPPRPPSQEESSGD